MQFPIQPASVGDCQEGFPSGSSFTLAVLSRAFSCAGCSLNQLLGSPPELLNECDVTQGCKGISLIIGAGMLGEHKDGFPRQQLMSLGESTEAGKGVCQEQGSIQGKKILIVKLEIFTKYKTQQRDLFLKAGKQLLEKRIRNKNPSQRNAV